MAVARGQPAGGGMRLLQVAAEIFPWVKTGGLGDVVAALPPALARAGADVRLLLPGYPPLLEALQGARVVASLGSTFGAATVEVRRGRLPGLDLPVYLIDSPFLYDRPGNPYLTPDRGDWPDNPRRFGLLGWVAAHLGSGDVDRDWRADLVHAHDWHAALACAHLALHPGPRPASVFTVHNLAFVGEFDPLQLGELQLPRSTFAPEGLEFHGKGSFMKAGLYYADQLTTVSPTYAHEIQTSAFGCGFEGLLMRRSPVLAGILNGVDTTVWNPATDPHLEARYDSGNLAGKAQVKAALQRSLGLRADPQAMLVGVVTRLAYQKGVDLLVQSMRQLAGERVQLALLGSGDPQIERDLAQLAGELPEAVSVSFGYDDALSHRIIAGADVVAVPSRYEPCGLTQLYGLRYGSAPVVHAVGGLADTVVDASEANLQADRATGFAFVSATEAALHAALHRAQRLHADPPRWRQLMRRAMAQDFSWDEAAARYLALFRAVTGRLAR
jgi:starch synthase